MPLISNCSMMPAWHQLLSMSGHVEESDYSKKIATIRQYFHLGPGSFFCLSGDSTITLKVTKLPAMVTFKASPIRRRSDYIIGLDAPILGPNTSKKLTRLITPVDNIRGKV